MKICALDQCGSTDLTVMSRQSGHAAIKTEIRRNLETNRKCRALYLEGRQLPQHGARRSRIKDARPIKEGIQTGAFCVARRESQRLLDGIRNAGKCLLIVLAKIEITGEVDGRNAAPRLP